jgi:hypothetical protein
LLFGVVGALSSYSIILLLIFRTLMYAGTRRSDITTVPSRVAKIRGGGTGSEVKTREQQTLASFPVGLSLHD